MSVIKVTAEELAQLVQNLNTTASSIESESTAARTRVQAVVGAGWEGAAAEQFNALFEEWNQSSAGLIHALTGVSDLLRNASSAYSDTEQQITRSFG